MERERGRERVRVREINREGERERGVEGCVGKSEMGRGKVNGRWRG